ncbi:MAG: MFS transporter [Planctomycetales bacterium]|nr:MFS transporter [Planctomycetales bacterium]
MYLAERTSLRLSTLCALYVAQGLPFGFVTVALAAYLSNRGANLQVIGDLIAYSILPWSFKWMWGPVIDWLQVPGLGRRRPWIILAQSLMLVTIGWMILTDAEQSFTSLKRLVLLLNVFASLQDVAVDALAVDLLPEHERGKANGLMYASSYFGTAIGGGGLGWLMGRTGFSVALVALAFLLLLILLFPILLRERPGDRWCVPAWRSAWQAESSATRRPSGMTLLRNLWKAFSVPASLVAALLALTVNLGQGLLQAVYTVHFTQELQWSQEKFSAATGGYAVLLGLAASVAGGFLADRFGAKLIASFASLALGILWVCFGEISSLWHVDAIIYALIYGQEILLALLTVSLFSMFLTVAWPQVAATQFTAYMSLMNLSRVFGSKSASAMSELLTCQEMFMLMGGVQMGLICIIYSLDVTQTRRVLGPESA